MLSTARPAGLIWEMWVYMFLSPEDLQRHLSITVTGRSLCGLVDAEAFDQPEAVSCTPCADAARMFYTAIKGPEWVKENL